APAACEEVGEEAGEARTVHVAAHRAWRLPRHPRTAHEQPRPVERRGNLRADRREHLLLPGRAGAVVLVRGAAVLAHARERERLLTAQVVLTLLEPHALAAEAVRADALLQRDVDAAEGVDQLREVREAHLDDVVDPQPV